MKNFALPLAFATALVAMMCSKEGKKKEKATGGPIPEVPEPAPSPDGAPIEKPLGHVVLVVDDGFDLIHEVFKDKIIGRYTLLCDKTKDDSFPDGTPFEEKKVKTIKKYKDGDGGKCELMEEIEFEVDSNFNEIRGDRDTWNAQIKDKKLTLAKSKIEKIQNVLSGTAGKRNYHGTNTAGLIAYQNPDVRLVVVQFELKKGSDAIVDDPDQCPKQAELDDYVELHKDADVVKAFKESPLSPLEKEAIEIQKKHKVTLINLSLGTPPRPVLEKAFEDAGCGKIDYSGYFATSGPLNAEREKDRVKRGVYKDVPALTIQAAGNEAHEIDDYQTAADCSERELDLILAGAYGFDRKRTSFTNFGKCVDFYMLGSHVVVPAPDHWLDVVDGTSFSAPLLVRYVTQRFKRSKTPKEIIEALQETVDKDGNMPSDSFPKEIAFDSDTDIANYALVSSSPRSGIDPIDPRLLGEGLKAFRRGF